MFSDNYEALDADEMCRTLAGNVHSANIPCMVVTMGTRAPSTPAAAASAARSRPKRSMSLTRPARAMPFAGTVIGLTYGKTLAQACEIGSRLAASVICISENVCPRFRPRSSALMCRSRTKKMALAA